jgi:hypothetical protein
MMREEIAVPACRELVRGRVTRGHGSIAINGRANGTERRIGAGRDNQLTHERRENHKPHGDEAKPCDSVDAGANLHDGQNFSAILSLG